MGDYSIVEQTCNLIARTDYTNLNNVNEILGELNWELQELHRQSNIEYPPEMGYTRKLIIRQELYRNLYQAFSALKDKIQNGF